MSNDILGNFISGLAGPEAFADTYGNVANLAIDEEERKRLREEEERKRRAEAGQLSEVAPVAPEGMDPSTVVNKQQVETRADGSQVHKTTTEVPAGAKPEALPYYQQFLNAGAKEYGLTPQFGQQPPTGAQPQPRQPGFMERMVNAVIPSAQAGTLPTQAQPQPPVADLFPVEPQRTLTPNEQIVEQPVIAGAPSQQAGAGRGFVNPPLVNAVPPAAVPAAPAAAPQAQVPAGGKLAGETDYDYNIRRQESGNRPNIGYHYQPDANGNRRSSAYGAYGITAGTYEGIQKSDPYFKDRDITSLSPEEQARANQVLTRQNSQQLTNYGIEATPGNLAASHFLGARGLRDYLQNGYISPAAAAANGGEEKVRQIVEGRINGQYAPASGAATVPVGGQPVNPNAPAAVAEPAPAAAPAAVAEPIKTPAQLGIDRYQSVQDDPIGLFALRNDESVPKYIRERAAGRLGDFMQKEKTVAEAETKAQEMIASGDIKGIAKDLQRKPMSQFDFLWQSTMMRLMGAQKQADNLYNQAFGTADKWKTTTYTDKNGVEQTVEIKTGSDGKIIGGLTIGDNPRTLNSQELTQAIGGAALGKGTNLSAEVYIDKNTGQRYRSGYDASGKAAMVNIQGGSAFRGDPKNLTIQSIDTSAAKAENAAGIKLRYAGPTSYTEAGAKAAGEFNFQNGTNIGYQSQQPGAPLVDLNTGKPVQVGAGGVITTTQSGTPGAAPAQGAPVTTAPAGQVPVQTAPAGQVPVQTAPAGQTPAQIATGTVVNRVAQEQFVKTTAPEVNSTGEAGRQVAAIRRQQLSTISSNPSILNIFNGTGSNYDRARNTITKLVTGAYGEENSGDFYKDVKSLGLTEAERGALEEFGNANMAINSKTLKANSGAGSVSNAEQKANQNANLQNLAETTPLGALQALHRSQFTGDMAGAKAYFMANNPGLNDDTKFNSAWAKESGKYTKAYEGIIEARAEFLKPFRPPAGATPEQISAFKDKVFKSFEMYPAPQFNVDSGKWNYQTANAQKAAARKLLGQ